VLSHTGAIEILGGFSARHTRYDIMFELVLKDSTTDLTTLGANELTPPVPATNNSPVKFDSISDESCCLYQTPTGEILVLSKVQAERLATALVFKKEQDNDAKWFSISKAKLKQHNTDTFNLHALNSTKLGISMGMLIDFTWTDIAIEWEVERIGITKFEDLWNNPLNVQYYLYRGMLPVVFGVMHGIAHYINSYRNYKKLFGEAPDAKQNQALIKAAVNEALHFAAIMSCWQVGYVAAQATLFALSAVGAPWAPVILIALSAFAQAIAAVGSELIKARQKYGSFSEGLKHTSLQQLALEFGKHFLYGGSFTFAFVVLGPILGPVFKEVFGHIGKNLMLSFMTACVTALASNALTLGYKGARAAPSAARNSASFFASKGKAAASKVQSAASAVREAAPSLPSMPSLSIPGLGVA
jgi:hypothetical protein